MIGKCHLCLEERELQFSHLLPRALYRLVGSGSDPVHPDTVQISAAGRERSSKQSRRHILCAECEERFNSKGERWVLHNCYRGQGRFRLRTDVRSRTALHVAEGIEAYSASEEEVSYLAYFSLSVVWRASLCDWPSRGKTYEAIALGPYQEEMRRFLNDGGKLPERLGVMIILSQLDKPVLAFRFPASYRVEACLHHNFHIPGMSFVLEVGKGDRLRLQGLCILRSPQNPIFVSRVGDEKVQAEVLSLMGKVAPPWAEYPLLEGVERSKS